MRPPLRILCVGRLVPVKGQHVLLDAAARLRAAGTAVEVVFVGDGPSRAELEARAGSDDLARFTGSVGQDEIRDLYAAADVFCLPSFAEGVPVVLMEAMAMGLPVVTTRIAGIPELVQDGVSGSLVPPGNVEALVAALDTLATDDALRRRYAAAGREVVVARYDITVSGRQMAALFSRYAAPPASR